MFGPSWTDLKEMLHSSSRTAEKKATQQSRSQTQSGADQTAKPPRHAETTQPGGPNSEPDPWKPSRQRTYSSLHYQGEIPGSNDNSKPGQNASKVAASLDFDPDAITPAPPK